MLVFFDLNASALKTPKFWQKNCIQKHALILPTFTSIKTPFLQNTKTDLKSCNESLIYLHTLFILNFSFFQKVSNEFRHRFKKHDTLTKKLLKGRKRNLVLMWKYRR